MIDVLRQHILARLGHDPGNLDSVLASFTPLRIKRNKPILQQGEVCRHVYFVARGALQVFVYDKDGNETTRDIVVEDHWCSELQSFGTGKPAIENIRTLEPCDLFAIDRSSFQTMVETVPQFDTVYKQLLEASYANSVYRINAFVSLSALERIRWLMEYRPLLMSRISSKVLASYLGIHKDVFSRLRARL